jgi:ferredoxin
MIKKIQVKQDLVDDQDGTRLLDVLLAQDLKAKMLCGGRGLCATCHVYVTQNADMLAPETSREALTLAVLTGARPNSRLACQAKVLGEGVEVELPEGLYVESFSDLEALVGQRSDVPVLHPVTGDVLVEAGKVIVRSLIMKLKDVDYDIEQVLLKN